MKRILASEGIRENRDARTDLDHGRLSVGPGDDLTGLPLEEQSGLATSRRSVLTQSPGRFGINEGATTTHSYPRPTNVVECHSRTAPPRSRTAA